MITTFINHRLKNEETCWYQVQEVSINLYLCRGQIHSEDREALSFQSGDICLFPSQCPRRFSFFSSGQHLGLHLPLENLPEEGIDFQHPTLLSLNEPNWKALYHIWSQAHRHQIKTAAGKAWANVLLQECLLLTQNQPEHGSSLAHDHHHHWKKVVEDLYESFKFDLTQNFQLEQLAQKFHCSPQHLIQQYKKVFQLTPYQHLMQMRVEAAIAWLDGSDLPIKVIASDVGYPDLQHFNKVIRRKTGLSPRQWREKKTQTER